jgi:hypothetical protein
MAPEMVANVRAWGPRVDLGGTPDVFAPQHVPPYTPPAPGIDNLGITSTDTFAVPGIGEVVVDFTGYVRVARSRPTAGDWNHAQVFTNLIEMCMRGEAPQVGRVIVTLNPDYLSTGQLWTPAGDIESNQPAKACRMAVNALFTLPQLGKVLFNKEPILLTINDVRAIPPAGNPGVGRIYEKLPLYDVEDPEGMPVADITALKFAMGTYLSERELEVLRSPH